MGNSFTGDDIKSLFFTSNLLIILHAVENYCVEKKALHVIIKRVMILESEIITNLKTKLKFTLYF